LRYCRFSLLLLQLLLMLLLLLLLLLLVTCLEIGGADSLRPLHY
jgi:hypothetical protein